MTMDSQSNVNIYNELIQRVQLHHWRKLDCHLMVSADAGVLPIAQGVELSTIEYPNGPRLQIPSPRNLEHHP